MKRLVFIFAFLLCCSAIQANARGIMTMCGAGVPVAGCTTEAESVTGSTAGNINPIGSASYNDYSAQVFTASSTATICKASLRIYRTETDSSPALTGKVCIYDATGYVSNTAWAANTSYSNSSHRRPVSANGYVYKITSAGSCTSHASTEPTWTTTVGATYGDGTCTWTNVGLNDAPGSVVGTCSDELNMISSATTSEGDVTFENISAAVTSGTKYFIVFYTPTLGDSGDYVRWAYATVETPATVLIGGATNALVTGPDLRKAKFILYK